jgi:hypothetical protein
MTYAFSTSLREGRSVMAERTQDTEGGQSRVVKLFVPYKWYLKFFIVGILPLFVFSLLRSRFDRLPLTGQLILVAWACTGTVYLMGLIVFSSTRKLWLAGNVVDQTHRWGFLGPLLNTCWLAILITYGFAIVSGFLYFRGVGTTVPERALTDPFKDSGSYYIWSFLNAVPGLEIPQTFGWERPFRFTDRVNLLLLLLYKLTFVGPAFATVKLIVQDIYPHFTPKSPPECE